MKYKLKNGMQVDLHEEDMKAISAMYAEEVFDISEMTKYFEDLHKHAVSKMEHISQHIITDEDSLDLATEYVAKHGTYMDFVKMLRYSRDYDISMHILESVK